MHALAARLYPICRSITGRGVRESLAIIRDHVPVQIRDVPSGTQVFDWTIPKEWNIRDAYVANAEGERVIDFRRHNLHVVQYSRAVRARMTLDELMPRLHTLPDRPDAIPYRTSYYKDDWGFCLADRQLRRMAPGDYEVVIDAALEEGRLTYGELHLAGERDEEILFHTHICHPSLANDNLSGLTVATFLAMHVAMRRRRYSYRFLFLPGLIGPLTWLALNEDRLDLIRGGLVLTGVGDPAAFTYKRSRRGDAAIDRAMQHLLAHCAPAARTRDFDPYGYDERQYCSPGFNLPVGALTRFVSGIPHLGRRPPLHYAGEPWRDARAAAAVGAPARERQDLPEPVAEGGAAARQARLVPVPWRCRHRRAAHGAALGVEPVRWYALVVGDRRTVGIALPRRRAVGE
jgi:aminopeptidase-like protein